MRLAAFNVIFALSLSACASVGDPGPGPGAGVMILNPELRSASTDYAMTMAAPRTPMTMTSGASVSSCGEYLALPDHVDMAPVPDNEIASLEYVVCDSLSVLQDALPVAATAVTDDMGASLARRLDLRTFRSSMHQLTTDEAFTLQALADHPLRIGAHTAELDSPGWYFKQEVVAVADIDASGQPDWLVWIVDQSLGGTYLTVAPLVIYDPDANGRLEASPLPH